MSPNPCAGILGHLAESILRLARCHFCSVMTVDASTNPDNEDLTAEECAPGAGLSAHVERSLFRERDTEASESIVGLAN